ncbi:MAG: hypothetical protein HYX89_01635 [Chloroflexi bacterium]|nr:hypothetical protein [Chloroflexota bacterium]
MQTVRMRGEVDGGEVIRSVDELAQGIRRFLLIQTDFRTCDIPADSVDHVVTDPPYYDSVQYSDLSTFFRVWLHQLLPNEADWKYDPRLSAVAEDASKGEAYGKALTTIWEKCHRALRKPQGRLIFTFHHWSHQAWAELTLSLKRAGFVLKNRYVVFSENPTSVHIRELRALKHDCILVLQPRDEREPPPSWPVQAGVDLKDSRQFCLDCGAALGFFLSGDMGEHEIRRKWQALLGTNGKHQKTG